MKGLTLIRPWDWAILHAGKDVENRTWKPAGPFPFAIAIHAGKSRDCDSVDAWIAQRAGQWPPPAVSAECKARAGHIVGVVTITGVAYPVDMTTDAYSPWHFPAQYGWIIGSAIPLPVPVPCKGALSLWNVPDQQAADVIEQLRFIGADPDVIRLLMEDSRNARK